MRRRSIARSEGGGKEQKADAAATAKDTEPPRKCAHRPKLKSLSHDCARTSARMRALHTGALGAYEGALGVYESSLGVYVMGALEQT
eukprot:1840040-Pleurochrysis_carterae.AAC.1